MSVENYRNKKRLEFAAANTEQMSATNSIVFVTLTESGDIDPITAGEHSELFAEWRTGVGYTAGNVRRYGEKLYKCIQAHTSQEDWTPDISVSLWRNIADPTEEWPEWSQPIGAADAYQLHDKVNYMGKHWISTTDNNVWEPGVYGWESTD